MCLSTCLGTCLSMYSDTCPRSSENRQPDPPSYLTVHCRTDLSWASTPPTSQIHARTDSLAMADLHRLLDVGVLRGAYHC